MKWDQIRWYEIRLSHLTSSTPLNCFCLSAAPLQKLTQPPWSSPLWRVSSPVQTGPRSLHHAQILYVHMGWSWRICNRLSLPLIWLRGPPKLSCSPPGIDRHCWFPRCRYVVCRTLFAVYLSLLSSPQHLYRHSWGHSMREIWIRY